MSKKTTAIPINHFGDDDDAGVSIEKMVVENLHTLEDDTERSHRHDRHSFFLLESGTVAIEIDFQKHSIRPRSIIYMHPDQVHRMLTFKDVSVISFAISNEKLHPEYLKLLESITPAKPLLLNKETFAIISEAATLCMKFSKRSNDKLYHSLLRDSGNAFVALVISQYLDRAKSIDKLSRFEIVVKAFKEALERNYTTIKRPAAYAQMLNISTPYLNECVKNATGHSVSHHIQERIVLEAKRMLYHSDRSVKEIAAELGYDDYPYFSRLFTKVAGMTALAFRNKNLD